MRIPSRTGVTAGVTAGTPEERAPSRRARRATVAALVATGLVSSSCCCPVSRPRPCRPSRTTSWSSPTATSSPSRATRTTSARRHGRGQARHGADRRLGQGVVEAGDVAFEINHPGGVCWGAGTDLKVTPDIKPGDRVSIGSPRHAARTTTTVGRRLRRRRRQARRGPRRDRQGPHRRRREPDQVEQRIVNPDLTRPTSARRDIRARPRPADARPEGWLPVRASRSPVTPSPPPTSSTTPRPRGSRRPPVASGSCPGRSRTADANRQGLTIAEYGELGGPGMGGCPAGPADAAPRPAAAQVVRSDDGQARPRSTGPRRPPCPTPRR